MGHTIWFPIAYLPWGLWAYVRSRTDLRWALVIGIVMLAVALSEAFAVPEMAVGSPAPFEQVLGAQRFVNRTPYATMFPYLLVNRGVVNCFERFARRSRVTPESFPNDVAIGEYCGEAYVAGPGEARIVDFTPNRIAVEYDAPGEGLLVLNQNFDDGWHADRSPAIEHARLIAASVPAGTAALVLRRPGARRLARPEYTPRTWQRFRSRSRVPPAPRESPASQRGAPARRRAGVSLDHTRADVWQHGCSLSSQ